MVRIPFAGLTPGKLTLDRAAAHYATKVRRLAVGDRVVLFDPEARVEADAEIAGTRGEVHVGPVRPASIVPAREVTVIQCVGKADKLDAVVRDATELGATAILPAISERSVATRSSDLALVRYRRIAVEAARQSSRGDVPQVGKPRPLPQVIEGCSASVKIVLHPGAATAMRSALGAPERSVAFAIGPEGGFTAGEIAMCERCGFVAARLGRATLRTETAAAAMLGALLVLSDSGTLPEQ